MRRSILPLLLLLAVWGCSDTAPARIGVVMSLRPGEAALIAVEDLRARGVTGLDAELRPSGEPVAADTALVIAEALAADPSIIAVVGHSNSAASLAASQVYNRAGLVQIAPSSTAKVYAQAGPYSFRMVPGDEIQARFLATVLEPESSKRIAVVYVNDDYGRGFFRELRPLLGNVVYEAAYVEPSLQQDMPSMVQQIGAAAPDLLVWLGRSYALRELLPRLRVLLPQMEIVCGDACDTSIVHENVDGTFTGLRFVRFVDPDAPVPELQQFRRRFAELSDEVAVFEAILTYDATLAIGEALLSGARTREQVRRFLHSLGRTRDPLRGIGGPIQFDEQGTLLRPHLLAEVTADGVRAVPPRRRD